MILVILVLLLLFGGGGFFYGGPQYGPHYVSGGVGLVGVVVLVLFFMGFFDPQRLP